MRHAQERGLGAVVTEVGFKLASNPDTVRAPDVAFVRQDRIPKPEPRGVWNGPPDLAVEVLSPDDRPEEVREVLAEYLTHGVPVVVLVDPDTRKINVLRPGMSEFALATGDVLDLGDAVRLPLQRPGPVRVDNESASHQRREASSGYACGLRTGRHLRV